MGVPWGSRFTRRQFLRIAGLGLGAAAGTLAGASARAGRLRAPAYGPGEGLYTQRFTYRPDNTVRFRVSLTGTQETTLSLYKLDAGFVFGEDALVAAYPIAVENRQRLEQPGAFGAEFGVALSLPASDLAPGLYEARIPAEDMQPERRTNEGNGFVSRNDLARFVVTPSVPGSRSRLLVLFDCLTGVAYGSYGGASIYGPSPLAQRSVSWRRPGLDISTEHPKAPLRFLRGHGYDFEFADLLELAFQKPGFLDAYDLVLAIGQFEYLPEEVLRKLAAFVEGGGNLLAATHEFGIFRVRLDRRLRQLTTYKWDWRTADPVALAGDPAQAPTIAGLGMNLPASTLETEILGQTVWAAHRVSEGTPVDLPVLRVDEVGWILEGTGFAEAGVLPGAFRDFAAGNLLAFDDAGLPFVADAAASRTPPETLVWAAVQSPDARAWWEAGDRDVSTWPLVPNGYATASIQERASGGTVVALPSPELLTAHFGHPGYERLLLNLMARLASRG